MSESCLSEAVVYLLEVLTDRPTHQPPSGSPCQHPGQASLTNLLQQLVPGVPLQLAGWIAIRGFVWFSALVSVRKL